MMRVVIACLLLVASGGIPSTEEAAGCSMVGEGACAGDSTALMQASRLKTIEELEKDQEKKEHEEKKDEENKSETLKTEAEETVALVMADTDTDQDGQLTREELLAHFSGEKRLGAEAFLEEHFADLDRDSDGAISPEELPALLDLSESKDDKWSILTTYYCHGQVCDAGEVAPASKCLSTPSCVQDSCAISCRALNFVCENSLAIVDKTLKEGKCKDHGFPCRFPDLQGGDALSDKALDFATGADWYGMPGKKPTPPKERIKLPASQCSSDCNDYYPYERKC